MKGLVLLMGLLNMTIILQISNLAKSAEKIDFQTRWWKIRWWLIGIASVYEPYTKYADHYPRIMVYN